MIDTAKFASCLGIALDLLKQSRGNILVIVGSGNSGKSMLVKKIKEAFPIDRVGRLPISFLSNDVNKSTDWPTEVIKDIQNKIIVSIDDFEDWNNMDVKFILELCQNSNLIIETLNVDTRTAMDTNMNNIDKRIQTKMTVLEL